MIVVRIWEGLGNQLFQYAYARALQIRTGEKVALDISGIYERRLEGQRVKREYMLDRFRVRLPIARDVEKPYFFLEQKNLLQKILFGLSVNDLWACCFYEEKDVLYKPELKYVHGSRYLMGWFQNEKYFKEYRDILLKELRPKKKIKISSKLRKLLDSETTVSVHVRRGDFQKANNDLPLSYYQKAKACIEGQIKDPCYLIFSDDPGWVKENLDFGPRIFHMSDEGLEDYEELSVMSCCRHNIIANSTFSWWGAWLNQNKDKIVVGPGIWFNYRENALKYNIMPAEWRRID